MPSRAFLVAGLLALVSALFACAEPAGAVLGGEDAAGPTSDRRDGGAEDVRPPDTRADATLGVAPSFDLDASAVDAFVCWSCPGAEPRTSTDAGDATVDAAAGAASERSPLVQPERWIALEPREDPFDDRPPAFSCASAAVMAETLNEERVLSVDTGHCEYLSARQPTLREVRAGETIKVRLWHFALSAGEPAEAHAVVLVDGLPVLDERVPIPQPGGLISRLTPVARAIPAGAPVLFHLHNHGANSWSLVEVSAGP